MLWGYNNNNTSANEYKFTLNPITDDFDICGKPGGAFRPGVLGRVDGSFRIFGFYPHCQIFLIYLISYQLIT